LFAAARYTDVRALLTPAFASWTGASAIEAAAFHDLVELRYVLAASLVQLGDHGAARAEIVRIRESAPAHPGAALQEIYIEKAEGRTRTELKHLAALISYLEERLAEKLPAPLAAYYRKFLAESYSLRGSALTLAGSAAEGVHAFLVASRMEADEAQAIAEYSNALFALNYVAVEERAPFAGLAEGFDGFFSAAERMAHTRARHAHARLRIGYISPDLRRHPVAFFVLPLLRAFDRERFEVFCYANNSEDAVSRTMAQQPGVHWTNILGLLPEEAARLVAADEIDILCDLSGHTKDNCLAVLARKPAPVQVTGLGYMGPTGLSTIDYLLGDRVLDAAEEAEDAAAERCRLAVEDGASQGTREERSERPLSLQHSHFCYLPFVAMPDVAPPPCLSRGYVTFGCFNNYSKVTDAMLLLWWQLLLDVPDARLLLKSRPFGSEEGRSLAVERFERLGLDASRIELRGFSSDYLAEYADMDIALDTAPYTGGLTTCEALYMGVPVVTLKGGTHGARFGASLLQNAGLPELIAEDAAQYVEIAKLLASSPETLQMLREKQRDMLLASPLMNFRQYVQEVEAAYEKVWRRWMGGDMRDGQ
ncbi:O-linked N-acetylglucosamine transferase, SPINDLY family protein, partial [Selenomonas sp. CM52]|uniref:O-linked N-acetylglucosamine transferase, SPINDLY family protein n=1 Tax=Selenomonas sp. CM52 TaxID=936381 RepID=UPI00027C68BE